ncbi:uncharacterized protein LOC133201023 [Saccostrea echinata]|uniref:uncharacterized protein LOC133201023 n=1 Tax=Saccostrea echinata TaxID=191078 RepID=UPI002A8250E4|nr:uncharacterized protein LOC133201023 [Saccostrea echinata]
MDFITKGLIGTGGCWGASVGVKRGKVDLSVFGTNTGKNPSTFGTNTGKGTVIGAKAKFTIGGSNKGGRRQGRGFWGGRRGGSWRGLGGAGPVGGGGTGGGFGGGGGGGDRVETETLQWTSLIISKLPPPSKWDIPS